MLGSGECHGQDVFLVFLQGLKNCLSNLGVLFDEFRHELVEQTNHVVGNQNHVHTRLIGHKVKLVVIGSAHNQFAAFFLPVEHPRQ